MTQTEYEERQAAIAQRYLAAYDLTAKDLQECHDRAVGGMETEPALNDPCSEEALVIYENYLEAAISSR